MAGRYRNIREYVQGSTHLYERDLFIVKRMGALLRVTWLSSCRTAGLENDTPSKKGSVNDTKLSNNLARAKSALLELALCNPWDYFATLTIDPAKYDRFALRQIKKDIAAFLHNKNRHLPADQQIRYLLVPEQHADGAWHFHGFFHNIPASELFINENGYLDWRPFRDRFGYISLDKVRDQSRAASYVTKYITKDLQKNVSELGQHLYYSSKGLSRATMLYKGQASLKAGFGWQYEHPDGYCKILTLPADHFSLDDVIERYDT